MPETLAIANCLVSLALISHAHNILHYTRYSSVQKLSNKQSAEVICRFDRLRTTHSKSQKAIWGMEYL